MATIDGMTIFYIIFGFFALCMLIGMGIMFFFYQRRKLTFTNFLAQDGKWYRKEWKVGKLEKTFEYDGEIYKFDIKKCTRDSLNRPIAHYYKGNPEQQQFNLERGIKILEIGTEEITTKDFITLMRSKVLKDIFEDGEMMGLLIVIIVIIVVASVILGIMIYTHNPAVTLENNNETISVIVDGVKQALQRG